MEPLEGHTRFLVEVVEQLWPYSKLLQSITSGKHLSRQIVVRKLPGVVASEADLELGHAREPIADTIIDVHHIAGFVPSILVALVERKGWCYRDFPALAWEPGSSELSNIGAVVRAGIR